MNYVRGSEFPTTTLCICFGTWRARGTADGRQHPLSTSQRGVRGPQFPLPPVPEQRAIAAALSDVDALLDGLDRLIAKKRDLKQAAMQQLLTGQTRLPGFDGEWVVRSLATVGDIRSGGTPSTTVAGYWDGGTRRVVQLNALHSAQGDDGDWPDRVDGRP